MKKIYCLVGFTFLFHLNVSAQSGWSLFYTFEQNINCVVFKDSLEGFIGPFSADSLIYKTTDGGNTWNGLNINGLNATINKIIFVDNDFGIGVGNNGTVIISKDGGSSWNAKNIGDSTNLGSVCSTLNGELFVCSFGGNKIYKSTDNGNSWDRKETDAFQLRDIAFVNSETGFAVGFYDTSIKTTDGGQTWFTIPSIIDGRSMFAIRFINENTGYVIGGEQIAKTTDGGNTWVTKYNSGGIQLNDITTYGGNVAWVVGTDKILRTTDAGERWVLQTFTPYHYLFAVSCVDSLICFTIGGEGALYKTSNGGSITSIKNSDSKLITYNLLQNYPNPFNPSTNIRYLIPAQGFISLKVYDLLGREIETLVNEEKPAGNFKVEFDAKNLSSGIYFYKLQAGDYSSVKKMVLVK